MMPVSLIPNPPPCKFVCDDWLNTLPPVVPLGPLKSPPTPPDAFPFRFADEDVVVVEKVPISKFPTGGKALLDRDPLAVELLPSSHVPIFISAIGPPPPKVGGDPPLPSRRLLPNILEITKNKFKHSFQKFAILTRIVRVNALFFLSSQVFVFP